ncbi:MAG: porin [Moritella sp.]|uniref:porin n=1 Tax=Moritella sp. TaxID=78556 RepID=UPI001D385AE5|nr:porin [Moritella sp.]NQZ51954.1 porin [Moritella sp.]
MKKTILATAILLAGAANAAEVYSNDTTTVSLGGSFRGHVLVEGTDNVKFEDAGSRFDIKAAKELDNGLKAFGQMEVKHKSDDTLFLDSSFVGLSSDVYGTGTLGKQKGFDDELYAFDFTYEFASVGSVDTQDQLKYTNSFGGTTVAVSLMDQDTFAIGASYEVAGLVIGADYMKNKVNDKYVVGAEYTIDSLTVAASYGSEEAGSDDTSFYGVGASYALGQASVYGVYDSIEDDKSEIIIGADYEIAKDVKTYVEFASIDKDAKSNTDEVLAIGARVYF